MHTLTDPHLLNDVAEIGRIEAVPRILETVAHITGSRFTAIARVTETTWTACATLDTLGFGLVPGGQLVLETTICDEIRQSSTSVVFARASTHPLYSKHHTPRIYGLESYASVPIHRPDGRFFGTLCAIDSSPGNFDEAHVRRSMELLAELVGNYLDKEDRLQEAETALSDAQRDSDLRDQFIAVLGHDLRSPLQAISVAADALEDEATSARQQQMLAHIASGVTRMDGLINDVLDFARGRLGGGIPISLRESDTLQADLERVAAEVAIATGREDIDVQMRIEGSVVCDPGRLSQLLANLLTNAVQHGERSLPVTLRVHAASNRLTLDVHNAGCIAPDRLSTIFNPFSREKGELPRPGLGLGIYIASEIAKSHGGILDVVSSESAGTVFTFRMPSADVA
ncbi:GAF domain-containing sensor histidine kinase [Stenotrophomonas maltophilia]|uniref:GAF domain-containing sensor histidine kinase n=1 Tax=Stenotrophomonas maltophilia TaxID=40324 RepID=UPI0009BCE016|nr:GAF domain-containing sensor histidine kinase [Stenotrophomonas maltophilia]MDZ5840826.1 GAF domain-containing sensor histidine kinase [Stenotrophomonas maltophilia]UXY46640.1 GAF domain-containing sensor histidine kinase [Stenotrophomonas maltophilia]HDS1556434.1 GAF domain-containing sensor histidine kinase [Stenotrophomonas maltophilia]HDS1559824.1 GAF domain-containing sensor histidine kinase [Stenotrophomonas maltophilia]HEL5052276.1 GAF domain-containing sensor histidine kinase [Steno